MWCPKRQTCGQQGHIWRWVFSWSELTLVLLAHGGGLSLLGVRHHLFGREVHLSHLRNAQLRRASSRGEEDKRGRTNKQTDRQSRPNQQMRKQPFKTQMIKSTAPKPNIHTTITKWHYCLTCSFGKHLLRFISNTWEYRETHVLEELPGLSTKQDSN